MDCIELLRFPHHFFTSWNAHLNVMLAKGVSVKISYGVDHHDLARQLRQGKAIRMGSVYTTCKMGVRYDRS